MKKIFVSIFAGFFFFYSNCQSQNLVPNPSFEDTLACPNMGGQIYRAAGWKNFGITPDYFNSCNGGVIGTPQNGWGNQVPIDGVAYAGLVFNMTTISNAREFIGCQLNQQMIIGETYYVSFYVSLSDISSGSCAINKIGVTFSTIPFDSLNLPPLNNFSHVYTNSIVSDSINWTKISGSFVADSSYNYVMLGNFFDDSQLDTLNCPTTIGTYSYYFFDLICVSPDPELCDLDPLPIEEVIKSKNNIKIFPNPAAEFINIHSNEKIEIIKIYSLQGELLLSKPVFDKEDVEISMSKFQSGFYILQVYSKQKCYNNKLEIIQ